MLGSESGGRRVWIMGRILGLIVASAVLTSCAGNSIEATTSTSSDPTPTTIAPAATTTTVDVESACETAAIRYAEFLGTWTASLIAFESFAEGAEVYWSILYGPWSDGVENFTAAAKLTREAAQEIRAASVDVPDPASESFNLLGEAFDLQADAHLLAAAAASEPDRDLLRDAARTSLDAQILFDRIQYKCGPGP